MPDPKYREVAPQDRCIRPDPAKAKFDWFAELTAELGPEHEIDPARELLVPDAKPRRAR